MAVTASGKVGLLWRGDRHGEAMSPRAEAMLGPLFAAFSELNVTAEAVVYADDAVAEVREQLLALDGVVVWVNPIQDGSTRAGLDALLREVAGHGVWVSAHPDVIAKMGTKEVLFQTRDLGWGTDTDRYESIEEFTKRFPARLGRDGVRVVKQARGNGGNGVWKVELVAGPTGADAEPDTDTLVRLQHAQDRGGATQEMHLGGFIQRCRDYFAWSGCLIDQPLLGRLAGGMIRCYLVHDEVVGFCHQWPRGLLAPTPDDSQPPRPAMEPPDAPAHQVLRSALERQWVPQMQALLSVDTESLPVIWDTDFLYGPKTEAGDDTYVLCEINVSAVWPYPPDASATLAHAAAARLSPYRHRR